jgi:hypothetical protein
MTNPPQRRFVVTAVTAKMLLEVDAMNAEYFCVSFALSFINGLDQ